MAIQLFLDEFNKHLQNAISLEDDNLDKQDTICYYLNYLNSINNNKFVINVFKKGSKIYISNIERGKFHHFIQYIDTFDKNINTAFNMSYISRSLINYSNSAPDSISILYNGDIIGASYYNGLREYLLNNNKFDVCPYLKDLDRNLATIDKKYNIILNNKLKEYFEFNIIDYNHSYIQQENIINELKQDLNNKHEKIRELELKVHYLESQIEKKVTIDYDAIKKRNKNLNTEFKRVAKLMKLGY
jgi:RNAse (barnase) inhibitor barstar